MRLWGCSMRAPTEKGLACRGRPRLSRSWNTSLALWPTARMAWEHSMVSRWPRDSTSRPVSCPAWDRMPVTLAEKRTSPPRAMISSRMRRTTPGSRSVPMWGLASVRISSGAPALTSSSSTLRMRASPVPVVSFPSEKAPAPPSPNCTLLSGSKMRRCQKASTLFSRSSTGRPRSSTRGRWPHWAKISPAKRPAGPRPTTTGR